jgi:hypothetical protein
VDMYLSMCVRSVCVCAGSEWRMGALSDMGHMEMWQGEVW